ncbi:MAG: acetoacetate--CoA ligase [Baekduiaceae bacterium]
MPTPLWSPSPERVARARMTKFAADVGMPGASYEDLWRWSVDDLDAFWAAIWTQFGVAGEFDAVLADASMPGAVWFPGTVVNYAERMFAGKADDALAIQQASEVRPLESWTWGRLRAETATIRAGLVARGVGRGDRVAAYLPNIAETIAAFAATASLDAIWSSAAPEFGEQAVIDRFRQIQPKVLLGVDGYRYGGKDFDRRTHARDIAAKIGAELIPFGYLDGTGWPDGFADHGTVLTFDRVPFDHPLWILYSSGTTGLPKPIVHGQGGMLLEHLKKTYLHLDAHEGDRILWFTTTGWMMWNFLMSVLLGDASIVLYDGNPAGEVLWDLAADAGVTTFGTSAAFLQACQKQGVEPGRGRDLSKLTAVGSTGSPLSPEGFRWVYDHVGTDTWLFSTSGGTDVCTAFVGGVPTLPVYEGELQARCLGAAVEAWNEAGEPVVGEVGELVITKPMPCMPVGFWGDEDGSRYRAAYFEMYPGIWRHGDWLELTERGTAIIHGRSDSTINRGGVRMGTAEIYSAVGTIPEVVDSLVVDVPREDGESWMPLFVVLREGAQLDDELVARIKRAVREQCSPRHVPSEVLEIAEVPRTLSGKALEIPVKRILMGADPATTTSLDGMANPGALRFFTELAGR